MLSIQHLQKHWILERNRHLADLEIDLLASVVRSEGFPDHLSKGLKRQGAKDRDFQVEKAKVWHNGCGFANNHRCLLTGVTQKVTLHT